MARTIQKKIISEDILFSDDFDESKLDQIESQLGKSLHHASPEEMTLYYTPKRPWTGDEGGGQGKLATAGEVMESFETGYGPASTALGDEFDQQASAELSGESKPQDGPEPRQQALPKMVRSKRVLMLSIASVLLLMIGGPAYFLWPLPKDRGTSMTQIIRHPIVIPNYEHDINFLILANAPEKKDLLQLDLELYFYTLDACEKFKGKRAFYQDIIYGFLQKQQPEDNSFQYWEKILERDLFDSLKNDHPEIRLISIHMKDFRRL
jgi:hypothetical protein